MKSKVDERSTALHSAVQVSQSVYTKKIRQLMNNFDATQSSFNSLQERISDVGRTAIRIGEQLEALDRQGLLFELTRIFSDQSLNVLSMTSNRGDDHIATVRFTFSVSDTKQLGQLMTTLRNTEGVFDVYRVTA